MKIIRYSIVVFLFFLLILVRAFSSKLFYDPLIVYFQNDYLYTTIPKINTWRLVVDMLFRYALNTLISLGIIWMLFQRKDYLKFAGFFCMVAFMVLITVFVFQLRGEFVSGYLFPFYVRRFIIHPLFLLILLPAFYYQKLSKR